MVEERISFLLLATILRLKSPSTKHVDLDAPLVANIKEVPRVSYGFSADTRHEHCLLLQMDNCVSQHIVRNLSFGAALSTRNKGISRHQFLRLLNRTLTCSKYASHIDWNEPRLIENAELESQWLHTIQLASQSIELSSHQTDRASVLRQLTTLTTLKGSGEVQAKVAKLVKIFCGMVQQALCRSVHVPTVRLFFP